MVFGVVAEECVVIDDLLVIVSEVLVLMAVVVDSGNDRSSDSGL